MTTESTPPASWCGGTVAVRGTTQSFPVRRSECAGHTFGFLSIAIMVVTKPDGSLLVTYVRNG
jgi:hypothetical protein